MNLYRLRISHTCEPTLKSSSVHGTFLLSTCIRARPQKSHKTITCFSDTNAARIRIVRDLDDEFLTVNLSGMTKVLIFSAFSLSGFDPGMSWVIISQNTSGVMVRRWASRPKLITIACCFISGFSSHLKRLK